MPTPVFLTGFEHGVTAFGAAPTPDDRIWGAAPTTTGGTPSIISSDSKHGDRCLDIPATSGAASYVLGKFFGTVNQGVLSFYIKFVGSLPTADCMLVAPNMSAGTFPSVWYNSSDTKIYARVAANGSSGFTVVPDTWYLIDFMWDASTGTRTADVTVNGTALGQASTATAASTTATWRMGKNVATTTANGNIRYDDVVVSTTIGDHPMGEHECLKLQLTGDGAHNVVTANAFLRGDAGTAIVDSDTDVYQQVDEIPFGAIGTTDSIALAIAAASEYVALAFEASPRSVDAWGVQFFFQCDASTTNAATCQLRVWDGTTEATLVSGLDVTQVTEVFVTYQRTTNPSGGAWTPTAIGNLEVRWGFSASQPGNPTLHACMAEVVFPVSAAPANPVIDFVTPVMV